MIPVFKYEKDLADKIKASGSITYASSISPITLDTDEVEKFREMVKSNAMANPNQFDLFYLESVLASVGWNLNDDVFDSKEIWAAKDTPVDKQFNYMHDEKDIIGHLTSSKIVSEDGSIITSQEDLPEKFDIVVGSVLYKTWSDSDLQERMDKIIAEIIEGKWCVSMECLFHNFDYAIVTPTGEQKIVARNDESSFLTKHLRAYGGSGEFDGNKVGRLLRNFVFSGKGLVDNPANPRSKITNYDNKSEVSSFAGASATVEELDISNNEQEFISMAITQEQYDALKAELEELRTSKIAEAQKKLDDANAKITELEAGVKNLTDELEASKEVAKAKDETIETTKAELEDVKTKLSEAEKSIAEQKLEATKSARKTQLLAKVDEAKADTLVAKFANASDEMFEALLESLPAKVAEETSASTEEETEETNVETDIDEANASNDADMSSGGDEVPADKIAKASAWFSGHVLRTTANNKKGE